MIYFLVFIDNYRTDVFCGLLVLVGFYFVSGRVIEKCNVFTRSIFNVRHRVDALCTELDPQNIYKGATIKTIIQWAKNVLNYIYD